MEKEKDLLRLIEEEIERNSNVEEVKEEIKAIFSKKLNGPYLEDKYKITYTVTADETIPYTGLRIKVEAIFIIPGTKRVRVKGKFKFVQLSPNQKEKIREKIKNINNGIVHVVVNDRIKVFYESENFTSPDSMLWAENIFTKLKKDILPLVREADKFFQL